MTHLIGKDILTTHCVYWPTMLMALDISLPKTIFAHGWWLTDNDKKMSKSEGKVVSPLDMKDIVGVHGLRYFLMRGMNPANDGQFSEELVLTRVNTELANNLGNLFSRSTGLVAKHFEGQVPQTDAKREETKRLAEIALSTAENLRQDIESIMPNRAIERVLELLSETNRYIDTFQPWKALKEGDRESAAESLYSALEVLRITGILLLPVMPDKMSDLLKRLGWSKEPSFADAAAWGLLEAGTAIERGEPLFPRIEA